LLFAQSKRSGFQRAKKIEKIVHHLID
jgi:hypothetical protein